MARMRIVKPRFFTNEEIAELPPLTRILFIGLWCYADRRGRLEDRPKRIKTEILPYDNHDVDAALTKLNDAGFITRFTVDAKKFIQINNFEKHQHCHVKEPESTIPAPCETGANPSLSLTGTLTGTGDMVDEPKKPRFVRPSLQELDSYCTERKNTVDAQKFMDYYESNGWRVGKNAMKDWKAAVRTWEKNDYGPQNGGGGRPRESDRDRMYREGKELARKTLGYGGTSTRLFDNLYPDKTKRRADANLDSKIIDSTAVEVDDAG